MFEDRYREHRHFYSEVGSRLVPKYSARYDEAGRLVLDEVGVEDIYAEIQSFADSCDIKCILARYRNGDTGVLQQVQGFYADIADLPTDPLDMLNVVVRSEQVFDSLPVDIKERFNNSIGEFLAAASDGTFMQRFDSPAVGSDIPAVPNLVQPVVEEVATNEQE